MGARMTGGMLEQQQDAALAGIVGARAIDVDSETLELALPAARRRALELGDRHLRRYYLIQVELTARRLEAAGWPRRRAVLRARAHVGCTQTVRRG